MGSRCTTHDLVPLAAADVGALIAVCQGGCAAEPTAVLDLIDLSDGWEYSWQTAPAGEAELKAWLLQQRDAPWPDHGGPILMRAAAAPTELWLRRRLPAITPARPALRLGETNLVVAVYVDDTPVYCTERTAGDCISATFTPTI